MPEETKYSPKRAAAIVLNKMLAGECNHPKTYTYKDLEVVVGHGWKMTEKRRQAIIGQIDTITGTLRKRLVKLVEAI